MNTPKFGLHDIVHITKQKAKVQHEITDRMSVGIGQPLWRYFCKNIVTGATAWHWESDLVLVKKAVEVM